MLWREIHTESTPVSARLKHTKRAGRSPLACDGAQTDWLVFHSINRFKRGKILRVGEHAVSSQCQRQTFQPLPPAPVIWPALLEQRPGFLRLRQQRRDFPLN